MPVPEMSPIFQIPAICPACGTNMRYEVIRMNDGRPIEQRIYCDPCKYGKKVHFQYVNCLPTKYEPAPPPPPPKLNALTIPTAAAAGAVGAAGALPGGTTGNGGTS